MDRDVTIELRRGTLAPIQPDDDDQIIGRVVWKVTDEDEATGSVVSVDIPGDRGVEREIKRHLNGNPDQIAIEGGIIPADIGTYADGIIGVLEVTSFRGVDADDDPTFEFSRSELPEYVVPPGDIG